MPFTTQDLFVIGFLVFLEGILSIDNALVLAMLARNLPPAQQKKALTYGLIGAVFFRLVALSIVTQLLAWNWVKFVGGGYLLLIALKHFYEEWSGKKEAPVVHGKDSKAVSGREFWKVVLIIELTDIAFAVDSILAAVALSNKFWVVFTGGLLGVIMMRVAAQIFLKLLGKYPKFETTAYLLVLIIGIKVIIEGLHLPGLNFHSAKNPAFWCFWALMFFCVGLGFRKPKDKKKKKRA